jgi:hypothetical protein
MAGPERLNDECGTMNDAETRTSRRWTIHEPAEPTTFGAAGRESQVEGGPPVIRLAACGKFLYA